MRAVGNPHPGPLSRARERREISVVHLKMLGYVAAQERGERFGVEPRAKGSPQRER